MFSTVQSCKLLVFLGLALCLLLPGAPAFADTPMPPSQESSQCALVEPLGYTTTSSIPTGATAVLAA